VFLAAAAAAGARAQAVGDAWDWPLPPRGFGSLSQTERVEYEKAEGLFRKKSYEAAAVEFEKFAAQHPKSGVVPHTVLLRGYSLLLANQRNQAIAVFTELMDFYSETADVAAPALYFKGLAEIQNGNVERGVATLKSLVDEEKYLNQPIADAALLRLAEQALARNDGKAAEQYWRKIVALFRDAFMRPEGCVKEARDKLTALYIRTQRFAALEELLNEGVEDPAKLVGSALYVYDQSIQGFSGMKIESRTAFLRWFAGKRTAFREAGKVEEFFGRALALAFRCNDREEWKKLCADGLAAAAEQEGAKRSALWLALAERLAEASKAQWPLGPEWKKFGDAMLEAAKSLAPADQVALYQGMMARMGYCPEPTSPAAAVWDTIVARTLDLHKTQFGEERDNGFARVCDLLAGAGCLERAYRVAERIEDPGLAQWKRIELLGREEKWVEMAKACEELEQITDPDYSARALRKRADLYRERLAKYEEAIRLYGVINDPPGTIWATIECYERWGKPEQAVASCSEIEGFFENDAPLAGFRKAQIWERAGQKEKTIAAARAVLKKYPKHQVSSQAHQMLERYGIRTGGGVTEAEE
jgi:tetratricopeptide (TPR) repeat protein